MDHQAGWKYIVPCTQWSESVAEKVILLSATGGEGSGHEESCDGRQHGFVSSCWQWFSRAFLSRLPPALPKGRTTLYSIRSCML